MSSSFAFILRQAPQTLRRSVRMFTIFLSAHNAYLYGKHSFPIIVDRLRATRARESASLQILSAGGPIPRLTSDPHSVKQLEISLCPHHVPVSSSASPSGTQQPVWPRLSRLHSSISRYDRTAKYLCVSSWMAPRKYCYSTVEETPHKHT